MPRKAYVEDAPDYDTGNTLTIVDAPPQAPSPPSAVPSRPAQPVNVFDFLVTEETPNASKISLGGSREQMQMVDHAPPVFDPAMSELDGNGTMHEHDQSYEEHGYSYGTEPISATRLSPRYEYRTPKAKFLKNGSSRASIYELDGGERRSTDKKRKRQQIEELDLTAARRPSQEPDSVMADAPPILHSGLTGGLHRLLSKSKFPPSPDYSIGSAQEPSPLSPVKRPKQIISKERGRKASSALVKTRSHRTSDESRPRKHHRSHGEDHVVRPKRKLKTIEYHSPADRTDEQQQLVVFRTRAELFLSFATKGPESEKGVSVNKALKRYHRERGEVGLGLGKGDEEKELWKSLRLRRNERGEVVLLF